MQETYRNYLIMFMLLGVSGMPFFSEGDFYIITFALVLFLLFIMDRDIKIDKEVLIILGSALILIACQAIIFSFFKLITVLGLVVSISVAYLSVKLLKEQFINYFLDVMLFFSIFSFVIFFPILLKPSLQDAIMNVIPSFMGYEYTQLGNIQAYQKTLILYEFNIRTTTDFGMLYRNSGPFWEPGAFGGYLILALIFSTIREGDFINRNNGIFLLAILTTQSTTAYIAISIFLLIIYLIFQNYPVLFKLVMVGILAVGITFAFKNITFLSSKIKNEAAGMEEAMEKGGDTRMASAALDWQDIKRFPFTGRGMWLETRIDDKFEAVMRNNGLTNLLARWGFFFFFIYFYWYYKGFKEYCRIYGANRFMPLAMVGMIWLIGMSENYFESPFFLALALLYTPYRTTELYTVSEHYNYEAPTSVNKVVT